MTEFVTVGVYGWNSERFFEALANANVDTFVDIRRRRAVRGSQYAFANSSRLQAQLTQMAIRYVHRLDLAPSDALRQQQAVADHEAGVPRRKRTTLSDLFHEGYASEALSGFDSSQFVAELGADAHIIALFCVERWPEACHRGILAERLQGDLGGKVTHLTP